MRPSPSRQFKFIGDLPKSKLFCCFITILAISFEFVYAKMIILELMWEPLVQKLEM
jgi:hypothetical protein